VPYQAGVAADASVHLVVRVFRFGNHLGIDSFVNALARLVVLQIRLDVADGAGRNRHVRLRNVERLHLRYVDVTGRAAYVVAARLVPKFYRETLRPILRPGLKPLHGIRR